jgi:hypothetical protein
VILAGEVAIFQGGWTMVRCLLLVAAMALGAAPAAFADANLIKDGGFERPAPPPGGFTSYNPGMNIGPWLVKGDGDVTVVSSSGPTGPAHRGAAFLNLAGSCNCGPGRGVEQIVETTPGTNYKLTFWVGDGTIPPEGRDKTSKVRVYNGSTLLISAKANRPPIGGGEQVWERFTVSFMATDVRTTLKFVGGDDYYDTNTGLDGVVLTAQP